MPRPRSVLVVPIRSFAHGKARLALALDDAARTALARRMATTVLAAAGAMEKLVVTDDDDVRSFALDAGARVIADAGSLDGAAAAGRDWARDRGALRVVVAHADLPFAQDLDAFDTDAGAPVAVLVADQHGDGTPIVSVPVNAEFAFAYGPGSFARHVAAARHAGLTVREVRDSRLGFDVDDADDLAALEQAIDAAARR